MFTKLRRQNNEFFIPEKKSFFPNSINKDFIPEIINFCFDMTFGKKGEHRKYRSGGTHFRRNGEIFCDTFQGKLGEYFVYQKLKELGINCGKPDIERWSLGRWDDHDFDINEKSINVKSMAHFSNLLLFQGYNYFQAQRFQAFQIMDWVVTISMVVTIITSTTKDEVLLILEARIVPSGTDQCPLLSDTIALANVEPSCKEMGEL